MSPVGCTRPAATASFIASRTRRLAARGWSAGMLDEPSFMPRLGLLSESGWRRARPVEAEVLGVGLLRDPPPADAGRPAVVQQRLGRDAPRRLAAHLGVRAE